MMKRSEVETQYTVVLRAPSAARFLPEEGFETRFNIPEMGLESLRLRVFTHWGNEGGNQIPRELIVEVRGRCGSFDEATTKFGAVARPIATIVGFVANVMVGTVEVHLAYDSTPSHDERTFLETFLPDERGAVMVGRIVRCDLLQAVVAAMIASGPGSERVSRALRQYEMALRYWFVGGEWLALSHLWMTVENLTDAVIKRETARLGIDSQGLAISFGIRLDDPERPWRQTLKHETRKRLIFRGDGETYSAARDGRNGLEHGFMELNKVAIHALKCADKTFEYVRRIIIELLGLPLQVAQELVDIKPMDVQSLRKAIRGRLTAAAEDPAMQGELYPRIEWRSGISAIIRDGSTFRMSYAEQFTVRTHPNVGFTPERMEVFGRLENGKVPIEFTEDIQVEYPSDSGSRRLLSAVMPLVDGATGNGASAAVIAMLNILSDATQLFGWAADVEAITTTMSEARALNDAAALLDLRPTAKVFKEEAG